MQIARHTIGLITGSVALSLASQLTASADPLPCRKGAKGIYVTWGQNLSQSGTGIFNAGTTQASVLPNFTWEVTGKPLTVGIETDEPFSGGNSMKGIYGQATKANNINIRIEANDRSPGRTIPHSAILTLTFDAGTPASGWGFSVIDLDVDQVQLSAKDTAGQEVPKATIAKWFVQKFDANPSTDGVNIPSWDPESAAVVGSESSSTKLRKTIEGGLDDTEAGSAWFQPNVALSELTFQYQSLQGTATPSYHVLLAACSTTRISPTPTPATSGDSDGDTIPDALEGSGDPDNDQVPNYLDRDSDDDQIPDSIEGSDDTDGDGIPDFEDSDSDGDDVPDVIERDPDTDATPTGDDVDQDGIDDGTEDRTDDPLGDQDSDTQPDSQDQDSDNDGKDDGDEAYDLDGDGDRDVEPSGSDEDGDGIDDAFDNFTDRDQLNPSFAGDPSDPPCSSISLSAKKANVIEKLNALAARVTRFSRANVACRGQPLSKLSADTGVARRTMQRILSSSFEDTELVCPTTVCPSVSTATTTSQLSTLARRLYVYAKSAKLTAMRTCGDKPSGKPDGRPITDDYLRALQQEIEKLPGSITRCE